jgi:N-acetylglucosaminyldiphosphoundecaprenol N-acetyl-beta-D-mannosaminyltransferase
LPRRVGGSDLVWSGSEQAARLQHRIFLLGGREGVAAAAANTLTGRYPDLAIAGTCPGSPDRDEESEITRLIRASRADILFVAFGAPEQELWIARNLEASGVYVAIGVGGSLDYLAGTARRAPEWFQEHGLEWLWRLAHQPRRWKRMLALPQFAWRVFRSPVRPATE